MSEDFEDTPVSNRRQPQTIIKKVSKKKIQKQMALMETQRKRPLYTINGMLTPEGNAIYDQVYSQLRSIYKRNTDKFVARELSHICIQASLDIETEIVLSRRIRR